MYDLIRDREDEHLEWFHEVHMPEKLARPGYTWASHYQVLCGENETISGDPDRGYIAMFGGEASSVFYNPSPAQLAPTQQKETRDMMGCRSNAQSLILSGEWAADGQGVIGNPTSAIDADMISLALCDVAGNDMDFGAWLVQDHLRSIAGDSECSSVRKFLASTGNVKHAIFHEHSNPVQTMAFTKANSSEWSARVDGYVTYPLGAPRTAKRFWPAIK
jgi:hypothetical protein